MPALDADHVELPYGQDRHHRHDHVDENRVPGAEEDDRRAGQHESQRQQVTDRNDLSDGVEPGVQATQGLRVPFQDVFVGETPPLMPASQPLRYRELLAVAEMPRGPQPVGVVGQSFPQRRLWQ